MLPERTLVAALIAVVACFLVPATAQASLVFEREWGAIKESSFGAVNDVAVDPRNGDFYVTDDLTYSIKKFSADGTYLGSWFLMAPNSTSYRVPGGVEVASDGSVLVLVHASDVPDEIRRYSPDGELLGHISSMGTGPGQFTAPADITEAADGTLWLADFGAGKIHHLTAAGAPIASFSTAFVGDATTSRPLSVAVNSLGHLYVVDDGTKSVKHLGPTGEPLGQWNEVESPFTFGEPRSVVVDASGSVYVTDLARFVAKFDASGNYIAQLGYWGPDQSIGRPAGMDLDASGHLWVTDTVDAQVVRLTLSGDFVASHGEKRGEGNGELYDPNAVSVHGSRVYVADTGNFRVQVFSPQGEYVRQWAVSSPKYLEARASDVLVSSGLAPIRRFTTDGTQLGPLGTAGSGPGQLQEPLGMSDDRSGGAFVADPGNDRVQRFGADSAPISGWDPDPEASTRPMDVSVAEDGFVYAVVGGSVRKFMPDGSLVKSWTGSAVGAGETIGAHGIAAERRGLVYVADTANDRVLKFNPHGVYLGAIDGSSSSEPFFGPASVAVDQDGAVYVADTLQDRVTKFRETDQAPPDTSVSGPEGVVTSSTVELSFSSTEARSTFECRLDGGAWGPCSAAGLAASGSRSYADLSEGPHLFEVRASDDAGNQDVSPAARELVVETGPPDTFLDEVPEHPINGPSARWQFSSNDPRASFECTTGTNEPWSACTSPASIDDLPEGPGTFRVRAIDDFGNRDGTPAIDEFVVDRSEPDTRFTETPPVTSSDTSPSFAFVSSEPGSFECRLKAGAAQGDWAPCTSPYAFSGIADGAYAFAVRARDAAGRVDSSPAEATFEVDTVPPRSTITRTPAPSSVERPGSFEFTASEPHASFECRLDGAAWNACVSPYALSMLTLGPHRFEIRATDRAGNVEAVPPSHDWTVAEIATPPDATRPPLAGVNPRLRFSPRSRAARAVVYVGCIPDDCAYFLLSSRLLVTRRSLRLPSLRRTGAEGKQGIVFRPSRRARQLAAARLRTGHRVVLRVQVRAFSAGGQLLGTTTRRLSLRR